MDALLLTIFIYAPKHSSVLTYSHSLKKQMSACWTFTLFELVWVQGWMTIFSCTLNLIFAAVAPKDFMHSLNFFYPALIHYLLQLLVSLLYNIFHMRPTNCTRDQLVLSLLWHLKCCLKPLSYVALHFIMFLLPLRPFRSQSLSIELFNGFFLGFFCFLVFEIHVYSPCWLTTWALNHMCSRLC